MGQDDTPAVPPILMQLHPLNTYKHTLRYITTAVAVDSYLFPFGRPHKPIQRTYEYCASTIRSSLNFT